MIVNSRMAIPIYLVLLYDMYMGNHNFRKIMNVVGHLTHDLM